MSGDDWSKEQEALKEAAAASRREANRKRDEHINRIWQRKSPSAGATRASAILKGLTAPPPPLKPSEANEWERLDREVKNGRPLGGLARHMYEVEKARRDGESDGG